MVMIPTSGFMKYTTGFDHNLLSSNHWLLQKKIPFLFFHSE